MSEKTGQMRTGVSRRHLVAGAAWSVPAVAIAGAAPAFAISARPKGLNGWVTLQAGNCSNGGRRVVIDGRGNFTGGGDNDRGIWVFIDDPAATLTNAHIIFYFPTSDLTFDRDGGSSNGWSLLSRSAADDRTAAPRYAYKTTYSGSWTYNSTHNALVANDDPYFRSSSSLNCGSITVRARRTVTVTSGNTSETISFDREVVLGASNRNIGPQSQPSSQETSAKEIEPPLAAMPI